MHLLSKFRIVSITFNFSFTAYYDKHVLENYNSVSGTFYIHLTMIKTYGSVVMEVTVKPDLRRSSSGFRTASTTVDIITAVLLVLTSWAYIISLINTCVLAKVYMCCI